MQTTNDYIYWDLFTKQIAGETSPEEQTEVEAIIKSDPRARQLFMEAQKSWINSTNALVYESIDEDKAYNAVLTQLNIKPAISESQDEENRLMKSIKMHQRIVMALAATFALILGWATMHQIFNSTNATITNELIAANNKVENFRLSDGSTVALNQNSKLIYPQTFEKDNRTVKLQGEGYFNITANKQRPFSIEVGEIKVIVVGTSFNVKAYPTDNKMIVTVDEGIVRVAASKGEVQIKAGHQATFNKLDGKLNASIIENPNFSSWKTGILKFKETKMTEVIETLESTYNINITVSDSLINNYRFTASFNQNKANEIIQVICKTFELTSSENEDEYIIAPFESKK